MGRISQRLAIARANRRLAKLIVGFLVFGLSAYAWQNYSQAPVAGKVTSSAAPTQKIVKQTAASVDKIHFDGVTIAYDYPSYYAAPTTSPASGQAVEQITQKVSFGPDDSRRVSITVMKNTNPISEDSGYKFRKLASSKYSSTFVTINGKQVEQLSKQSGGEVDYYIPGKNFYAVLAVSSSRVQDDYQADALSIASSVAWLN